MPGKCNHDVVVYQTTVNSDGGKTKCYVGLAKHFKQRWGKHKKTLENIEADGQTKMSRYYWQEKSEGRNPKISWKYLETNVPTFNPVKGKCRLCLRENFNIVLKPNLATLNQRQEVFAQYPQTKKSESDFPQDMEQVSQGLI